MRDKKGSTKLLIIVLIILIIIASVLLYIKISYTQNNSNNSTNTILETILNKEPEKEKINIYNGTERPIAVMIDNVGSARPQAGLNDAYIVYEITVEGRQTRLMALFKGKNIEKIGPIRSSRHYFLDYALENDAIYVHYGWSPKAKSDISTLNINNINGMSESSSSFWRVKDKSSPHNVVTSSSKILEIAKRKGYSTTSTKKSVLNYTAKEFDLENGESATDIKLPYSKSYSVSYKYDEETKKYTRYYNKTVQKDWKTKEVVQTKNIIITYAKNTLLNDGSGKDRQNLSNIGSLDGYYITDGKAIKIKCEKQSRRDQTIYKDLDGNEIKVNDGNTFIQIVPIDANITIE